MIKFLEESVNWLIYPIAMINGFGQSLALNTGIVLIVRFYFFNSQNIKLILNSPKSLDWKAQVEHLSLEPTVSAIKLPTELFYSWFWWELKTKYYFLIFKINFQRILLTSKKTTQLLFDGSQLPSLLSHAFSRGFSLSKEGQRIIRLEMNSRVWRMNLHNDLFIVFFFMALHLFRQ